MLVWNLVHANALRVIISVVNNIETADMASDDNLNVWCWSLFKHKKDFWLDCVGVAVMWCTFEIQASRGETAASLATDD